MLLLPVATITVVNVTDSIVFLRRLCVCVCLNFEHFVSVLQMSKFLLEMQSRGMVEVKETSKGVESIVKLAQEHNEYVLRGLNFQSNYLHTQIRVQRINRS